MQPDHDTEDFIEQFSSQFLMGEMQGGDIVKYFKSCDVEITWARQLDREGYIWGLIAKPRSVGLIETFGILREIAIICTGHQEFQARLLARKQEIESAVVKGRLQDDMCIVISNDSLLADKLRQHDEPSMAWIPLSSSTMQQHIGAGNASIQMRAFLQNYFYARDFFDRADPVVGADYFGRDKLMQDISAQLGRGSHVGLYGLRKVGKTSLIKRLSTMRNMHLSLHFIHIDLLATPSNHRHQTFLLYSIAREFIDHPTMSSLLKRVKGLKLFLKNELGSYARLDSDKKAKSFSASFDNDIRLILRELSLEGGRLVIILDEIEQLFPTMGSDGYEEYAPFLGYLRGLAQQIGNLSLLVVGVNPNVSEAQLLGKTPNPVFGSFVTRYMTPLTKDDIKEMLKTLGKKSGVTFSYEAVDALYEWLGGHPFLTRRFGSLLLENQTRPFKVDVEMIGKNREMFIRRESSHLAEMVSVVRLHYPDEFSVLHSIACEDGVGADSIGRLTLTHLEGYQLVEIDKNRVTIKSNIIREWLVGLSRSLLQPAPDSGAGNRQTIAPDGPAYEEIRAVAGSMEILIRRLVRDIMEKRWAGKADQRIRKAIGDAASKAADERMAKTLRASNSVDSATEILDYVYPADLKAIIIGNEWQEFKKAFGGIEKADVEKAVDALINVRNEVAHIRKISIRQEMKLKIAYDEFAEWTGGKYSLPPRKQSGD